MGTQPVESGARAAMLSGASCRKITIAVGLAGLATTMAHSQAPEGGLEATSIDEMKEAYVSCNRAAMDGQLTTASIMECSILYEGLKRRAFGGDFEKLLAWSREQSSLRRPARCDSGLERGSMDCGSSPQ